MQIQDDPSLKWPSKLKSDPSRRTRDKYCRFHRDYGHITEDWRRDNHAPKQQPVGEIRVISGGYAGGGETATAQKTYARRAIAEVNEVGMFNSPSKTLRYADTTIMFSEADAKGIQQPHDDPLVVSMVVANYTITRILIDNGSSADIIFSHVFDQMMIGRERLRPMTSPLVGFSGDKVYPLGAVTLPVTAGTSLKQVTFMVDFIVVDCPSAYNVILGRTALNSIRAITSTYHLLMCFLTEHGVGELRGDQATARECYLTSLREKMSQETIIIEGLEVRGQKEVEKQKVRRAEPMEDLLEVSLDDEAKKKVSI
ncbi:uncharacterized protein LOC132296580 [Cornus florida]|uniref:uncharacterized protein LOC132296580 n=1 Tax=Cornus florida TaxID=4283 RepID=UPI002897ED5C|nr:uncharacterized protein LOC132296580 [Cornus florida]